jgi:glycosyltransferase involved in cell wall biosynthesis
MSVVVDILLPTYNRAEALSKNLDHLISEIERGDHAASARIVISDNASPDSTKDAVRPFLLKYPALIRYYRQEQNIGLEANMVFLLGKASAPFVLWTGDDDYIAHGYLNYCIEMIKSVSVLNLVIPGLASLHADGTLTPGRQAAYQEKQFTAGVDSALELSHMAHQMSGLLMRREGLLDTYVSKPEFRNPYLFIQLATQCLLGGKSVFSPGYVTHVTVFNEKDWGYNSIGLLDEVFKSYLHFNGKLTETEIADLMVRFSVLHSYRYSIRWYRPMRLWRQYRELISRVPDINGFRSKLRLHLMKDYIKSFVP